MKSRKLLNSLICVAFTSALIGILNLFRFVKHMEKISPRNDGIIGVNENMKETLSSKSGIIKNGEEKSNNDFCVEKKQKCKVYKCNNPEEEVNFGYSGKRFDFYTDERYRPQIIGSSKGSGCFVSHKYKFVYLHVLKAGGTAIKTFLKKGLCSEENSEDECPAGSAVNGSVCRNALNNKDYFVWSFARNPFSRMFSAYAMSQGGFKKEDVTFETFVLDRNQRRSSTRMSPSHYVPQLKFLFSGGECPGFDFLGRLENIEEDMPYVLERIGSPELTAWFQSNNNTIEKKNSWGTSKKKEDYENSLKAVYSTQAVIEEVVGEFANDFRLLGYNSEEIP